MLKTQEQIGICFVDKQFNLTQYSDGYKELVKILDGIELEGNPSATTILNNESLPFFINRCITAFEGKEETYSERFFDTEGKTRRFNTSYIPFYGNGLITGCMVVYNEKTDLVQEYELKIEEYQEFLDTVGSTKEGVMASFLRFLDGSEKFLYISAGINSMAEVSPVDVYTDPNSFWSLVYEEDVPALRKKIQKAVKNLSEFTAEWRIKTKSGLTKWIKANGKASSHDGDTVILDALFLDITNLKTQEDTLEEYSQFIDRVGDLENGLIARHLQYPDGSVKYLYISDGIKNVSEITPEEVYADASTLFSGVYEEDLPHLMEVMEKACKELSEFTVEWRIKTKSGKTKWLKGSGKASSYKDEIIVLDSLVLDVTDLKNKEFEVVDYSKFIDRIGSNDNSWIARNLFYPDGTSSYIYISEGVYSVSGVTPQEVYESPRILFDMVLEEDLPGVLEVIENAIENLSEYTAEYRIKTRSGPTKWLKAFAKAIPYEGNTVLIESLVLDITQTKEKEEEVELLSHSMASYHESMQTIANKMTVVFNRAVLAEDGTLIFEFINDAVTQVDGYTPEEIYKDPKLLHNGIHEEDKERIMNAMEKSFSNREPFEEEWRILDINGEEKWLRGTGKVTEEPDGKLVMYSMVIDITSIKKSREEVETLNKEIDKYQDSIESIANSMPGVLARSVLTPDGLVRFRYINDSIFELSEVTPEEVYEDPNVLMGGILEEDKGGVESAILDSYMNLVPFEKEWRIVTKSGKRKWVKGTGKPIRYEDGSVTMDTVSVDITNLKRNQEYLRLLNEELEKAIDEKNQLFQELHHRVKNSLTLVISMMQLRGASSSNKKLLEFIKDTISRIITIAKTHDELLSLEEMHDLFIDNYIENLVYALRRTLSMDPDLIHVKFDLAHLKVNYDFAIRIGLIVNEIFSTTLKATTEYKSGAFFEISLKQVEDVLILKIKEYGQIFTQELENEFRNSLSLGLTLLLVQQLDGVMEFSSEDGIEYKFSFPLDEYLES